MNERAVQLEDGPMSAPPPSTGAESSVLEIRDLTYSYPSGVEVLAGVDFSLGRGEIVSIVGPSGCGKSTMLGLIAGLVQPTGGTITWNHPPTDARAANRQLAMVFQRDTVLPWRTVKKNVQFGLECVGVRGEERRTRIASLLELGGLTGFEDAYPRALSGGMRRRLALLMGLSVQPQVLLLDEPFAAVDEPTRIQLLNDVLNITYAAKISVILVTHDIGEAVSVSDRIVILSHRPSHVHRVVPVPFGHDRDILSLRESSDYADVYGDAWHEVWRVIRGNDNV